MAVTSRSAAVFLLDCSASMNRPRPFKNGLEDPTTGRERTSFEVMKEYVKAKVVQRIMRGLKTTPVVVLAFGYPKTKNIMTTRAKEAARENGEAFDRQNDGFQGVYEVIPLTFNPDQSTLERIDLAVAGQGQDGDAHTGLIAAIETLDSQSSIGKYPTKEIFVLTDGESVTDWDEWKGTVRGLSDKGMSVKVVGVDFDDEYMGFQEEEKSETKRENERMFAKIVDKLNGGEESGSSIVANAVAAVEAIGAPNPKRVNSRADKMTLKLGDSDEHPDRALTIYIDVKKAVVPAAIPSMKKMSLAGFDRIQQSLEASQNSHRSSALGGGGGTKRVHDELEEDGAEDGLGHASTASGAQIISKEQAAERFNLQQQASMYPGFKKSSSSSLGKIGANFEKTLRTAGLQESDDVDADLAVHGVNPEPRYYYRPTASNQNKGSSTVKVKQRPILGGESDEEEDAGRGGGEEDREEEERKEIGEDAHLVDAYWYGGDLIQWDFEGSFGKLAGLKMGMEVISFMKISDVRYDWRMGDVYYVYASIGFSGSEKLFSAFVNGMEERGACAVVRYIKKGFNSSKPDVGHVNPDPQVGLLFPATDRESKSEFCYYIRLPFGEDIRSPGFASLTYLFNRKGERIESHPNLPTKLQDQAMDDFVDAMNLEKLTEEDEDGSKSPWFNIHESYSPAIHNIQNTLMFRLTNPDGDLPAIPSALTRYLDPPRRLVDFAIDAKDAAVEAFKVLAVPPKPKKTTKANENYVQPEDDKAGSAFTALLTGNGTNTSGADATQSRTAAVAAEQAKAPRVSQVKVNATSLEIKSNPQAQSQSESPLPPTSSPAQKLVPVVDGDEEMEEEPDTEDEDGGDVTLFSASAAGTTPETSFATTSNASTTRRDLEGGGGGGESISSLVETARRLIETSFSSQNFAKATAELHKARNEAIKRNSPSLYNSAIRSFAEHLVSHKHRDYLRQLEVEDLGLLVGNGTTESDAEDFLEALN